MLDDLLRSESDPDRLLAVRVVVHGTSSLHDRLHADPERYVAEVRNLAMERGEDRLWIEKVEFQTRPARAIAVPDGPIEELREVLDQLRADPDALAALGEELGELRRKLPAELIGRPRRPAAGRPRLAARPARPGPAALARPAPPPRTRGRLMRLLAPVPEGGRPVHRRRARPVGRPSTACT